MGNGSGGLDGERMSINWMIVMLLAVIVWLIAVPLWFASTGGTSPGCPGGETPITHAACFR